MSAAAAWAYLALAIAAEVTATSCLKAAEGFTRPWPSLVVVVGYAAAFYFLALTLKTLPLGVAYAVWSGVGIALLALIGWAVYGQVLSAPQWAGLGLILLGVLVLQLFSATTSH